MQSRAISPEVPSVIIQQLILAVSFFFTQQTKAAFSPTTGTKTPVFVQNKQTAQPTHTLQFSTVTLMTVAMPGTTHAA